MPDQSPNIDQIALLQAIRRVQESFIEEDSTREVFTKLLNALVELTGSEYGFVGEVCQDDGGDVYLRALSLTDISWDDESRALYRRLSDRGFELRCLDSLYGEVLRTGDLVIANDPENDPRRSGLPQGHPPLRSLLCLPVKLHGALLGVAAVANRAGGYTRRTAEDLEPLVLTAAQLLRTGRLNDERRLAESQLIEAKLAADRASDTKTEFLANMSHELRTPMTAILGFTDLLEDTEIPLQEREEALATVRRNGQYLLQLLDDILDLSKVEAGRMELERSTCSPWRIAQDVVELLQSRAAGKGIGLTLTASGPVPAVISTDPVRFRQVLVNLVGNAIKFTEHGGVTLAMSLAGDQEPKLQVAVRDTGIGIAPAQLEHVFQPFRQADGGLTRRKGGTGLGLSISRRLADLMGGSIQVVSALGEGSTFTMQVDPGPIAGVPCMSPQELVVQSDMEGRAREKTQQKNRVGGRVLLVEDGPDNQRLIARIVRKAGAEVEIAENGRLGVDAALAAEGAGQPFDLVLMDMQMPVMDGYEAARSLRNAGYERPIVALTAHAMTGDRERCIRAGCSDYTTKPIRIPDFLAILRRELPQGG